MTSTKCPMIFRALSNTHKQFTLTMSGIKYQSSKIKIAKSIHIKRSIKQLRNLIRTSNSCCKIRILVNKSKNLQPLIKIKTKIKTKEAVKICINLNIGDSLVLANCPIIVNQAIRRKYHKKIHRRMVKSPQMGKSNLHNQIIYYLILF